MNESKHSESSCVLHSVQITEEVKVSEPQIGQRLTIFIPHSNTDGGQTGHGRANVDQSYLIWYVYIQSTQTGSYLKEFEVQSWMMAVNPRCCG